MRLLPQPRARTLRPLHLLLHRKPFRRRRAPRPRPRPQLIRRRGLRFRDHCCRRRRGGFLDRDLRFAGAFLGGNGGSASGGALCDFRSGGGGDGGFFLGGFGFLGGGGGGFFGGGTSTGRDGVLFFDEADGRVDRGAGLEAGFDGHGLEYYKRKN